MPVFNCLRQTDNFYAIEAPRNKVRIQCRISGVVPRQRTISRNVWLQLRSLSDKEFDNACCLDLNIGTHYAK